MPIEYTLYSKAVFQGMTYAGPLARRHPLIRAVDDLLERYPNMSNFLKCLTAFKIVEYCDEYYTMVKRERGTSARLAGVVRMRQRAVREYGRLVRLARVQCNFRKLMHNPKFKRLGELQKTNHTDAKGLEDDALLEALDDLHRVGHGLKPIQEHWLKSNSRKNFWDYIDEYLRAHPTTMLYQVKYLDENERRAYEVRVVGGRLWRGYGDEAQAFDTTSFAVNSPRPENIQGWGIFVMSMDYKIYSGSSFSSPTFFDDDSEFKGRVNFWESGDIFHHSSFLGGRPVLCAGEWLVKAGGDLVCVSPRSGHYQPPVHLFKLFLKELQRRGLQLNHLAVAWPWPGYNDRRFYNAQKIMLADEVVFRCEPKLHGEGLPMLDDMFDPQSDQGQVQSQGQHANANANANANDPYQNLNGQPEGQGGGTAANPHQGAFYQPPVPGNGTPKVQQPFATPKPNGPPIRQPGRLRSSQLAPWSKG